VLGGKKKGEQRKEVGERKRRSGGRVRKKGRKANPGSRSWIKKRLRQRYESQLACGRGGQRAKGKGGGWAKRKKMDEEVGNANSITNIFKMQRKDA